MSKLTLKQRRALAKQLHKESVKRTGGKYRTTARLIEKAIPNPAETSEMSWGFCRTFDFELKRFTHYEMPGTIKVLRTKK